MRAVVPGESQNGDMKPEGWALIVVGTLSAALISTAFLDALGRLAPGQAGATALGLIAIAASGFVGLLFSPEARERRARRRRSARVDSPAAPAIAHARDIMRDLRHRLAHPRSRGRSTHDGAAS